MNPRPLVIALDDRYAFPFKVMWHSLLVTDSLPPNTLVYVLHDETLGPDSREAVHDAIDSCGHLVRFVDTSEVLPANLPNLVGSHVTRATYYRLFIGSLLPQSVESIVYLDTDTIAMRSIRDLFDYKLTYPIAAVSHFQPSNGIRLWGAGGGSDFQAGVMLADLVKWRKGAYEERFKAIMRDRWQDIHYWDQDVLNLAFENQWQRLPWWFNVFPLMMNVLPLSIIEEQAVLLHFAGSEKPWKSKLRHSFFMDWNRLQVQVTGKKIPIPRKSRLSWPRNMNDLKRRVRMLLYGY